MPTPTPLSTRTNLDKELEKLEQQFIKNTETYFAKPASPKLRRKVEAIYAQIEEQIQNRMRKCEESVHNGEPPVFRPILILIEQQSTIAYQKVAALYLAQGWYVCFENSDADTYQHMEDKYLKISQKKS